MITDIGAVIPQEWALSLAFLSFALFFTGLLVHEKFNEDKRYMYSIAIMLAAAIIAFTISWNLAGSTVVYFDGSVYPVYDSSLSYIIGFWGVICALYFIAYTLEVLYDAYSYVKLG